MHRWRSGGPRSESRGSWPASWFGKSSPRYRLLTRPPRSTRTFPCARTRVTCFWHDPDSEKDRDQARHLGGVNRKKEGTLATVYEVGRLESVLSGAGFRVATLKSDTVSADRREEWLARRVKQGLDVFLVHPRLVQTGLDLVDFPSIVWYEVEYSVYTMRQASRRSWRIGQRLPVQVVYFAYSGTLQAQALALVAKKLQSSLAVEGELVRRGWPPTATRAKTCCCPWPAA